MAVEVSGPAVDRSGEILTEGALELVSRLHERFASRRDELLAARQVRREEVARTGRLDLLPETAEIRAGDWRGAPAPADPTHPRVEITRPPPPQMMIKTLNSRAQG